MRSATRTLRAGLALAFVLVLCHCRAASTPAPAATEIRVLTDRTASHLEDIFTYYEKAAGVKVVTNFVGDGLLERLERRPKEADLVVTKNADLLELAKQKGLLGRFSSQEIIDNVPGLFRDKGWHYAVLSYRLRAIYYARDRVTPKDLSTYAALAEPRWKGRVCLRSGLHEYNISLFSQMAVSQGVEATEALIKGLGANLARAPKGNDRAQVRALL